MSFEYCPYEMDVCQRPSNKLVFGEVETRPLQSHKKESHAPCISPTWLDQGALDWQPDEACLIPCRTLRFRFETLKAG